MQKTTLLLLSFLLLNKGLAQTDKLPTLPSAATPQTNNKLKWSDKIAVRGYAQVRYNGLWQTSPNLECEQCDKSWGGNSSFSLRRMRIIIFGQIHERVFIYVQPDFASALSPDNLNFGQLRDAYFDLGLDKKNEFRFRIGQSKIPFGFENLQSSQNRLPLDRNDALNSAALNERDLGVFFYWAPEKIRKRFAHLVSSGLKGSGDYGVLGIGAYNGQGANKPDLNSKPHIVARITYPFLIGKQLIEPSLQAYTGQWTMPAEIVNPGVKTNTTQTYLDQRFAATFNIYPQPFGLFAEYNVGTGPEYDRNSNSITNKRLQGGYITLTYLHTYKGNKFYPFVRMQHYSGGKKFEQDARSYGLNEYEVGLEWLPIPNFELVVMYTNSQRRYEDSLLPFNVQRGQLLRIQAQFNF